MEDGDQQLNKRQKNSSSSLSSVYNVMDDVLIDIFLRLPDYGTLVRCGAVCKRWLSLLSTAEFFQSFVRSRPNSEPAPITLLFLNGAALSHQLFSDGLRSFTDHPHHRSAATNLPRNTVIRSSFIDLLLLSRARQHHHYSIFNPLTGQRARLPNPPSDDAPGVRFNSHRAIIFKPGCLRVVVFSKNKGRPLPYVSVFASETRLWERAEVAHGPPRASDQIVACWKTRTIHWLQRKPGGLSVAVFDPFKAPDDPSRLKVIPGPFPLTKFNMKERLVLGSVRGRLRLCRLSRDLVTVWELKDGDDGRGGSGREQWRNVVHNRRINIVGSGVVVALHPMDKDVLFILAGLDIYTFHVGVGSFRRVGQLSRDQFPRGITRSVLVHLRGFLLLHVKCPNHIPRLS